MGLYLCVFDDAGNELEGVEVGSYGDFNFFRDTVIATNGNGNPSEAYPVLSAHSDSDGEWASEDARNLLNELSRITELMCGYPPVEFNSKWKKEVAKTIGISPRTLLECFFDIDGEPLIERLGQLAQVSISTGQPILFQ